MRGSIGKGAIIAWHAVHIPAVLAATIQIKCHVDDDLGGCHISVQYFLGSCCWLLLLQALVAAKLELAQCCEREVIGRHELYKARETNLKLASKMTNFETLVYANKK